MRHSAEQCFTVLPSVLVLGIVMLNVFVPSAIMLCKAMLRVIRQSVVTSNVVMQSVMAPDKATEQQSFQVVHEPNTIKLFFASIETLSLIS